MFFTGFFNQMQVEGQARSAALLMQAAQGRAHQPWFFVLYVYCLNYYVSNPPLFSTIPLSRVVMDNLHMYCYASLDDTW